MDEYSQLGTTGPVSPMIKGLLNVQKKKRASDRERRESNHKRRKKEEQQKDDQDQIVLSRKRDFTRSVGRSEDEVPLDYGRAKPKQKVRKKIDLVI